MILSLYDMILFNIISRIFTNIVELIISILYNFIIHYMHLHYCRENTYHPEYYLVDTIFLITAIFLTKLRVITIISRNRHRWKTFPSAVLPNGRLYGKNTWISDLFCSLVWGIFRTSAHSPISINQSSEWSIEHDTINCSPFLPFIFCWAAPAFFSRQL